MLKNVISFSIYGNYNSKNIFQDKKDFMIKVFLDIQINTSCALLALKPYL
jgi:hypothetical protein